MGVAVVVVVVLFKFLKHLKEQLKKCVSAVWSVAYRWDDWWMSTVSLCLYPCVHRRLLVDSICQKLLMLTSIYILTNICWSY